ncbi:MAG: oligosaccharide flippase family protein [Dechloromonas sp.]|nr:oligosaccharide flippase family protein [Dechloromonas sp.]
MFIAFFTGIIVARQLAPELYGMLSFANALVGVLSFLNFAAIEAIVVLALVREPEQREEILGSALILRLLGGILTVTAVVAILPFLEEQPPLVAIIAPIIATATLFTSMEVGEYWLRQILASKYGVIARQSALLLGGGGRIWATGSDSPLLQLAVITALEAMLVAACLAIALKRLDAAPWRWRVVWGRCRQLLNCALPLLMAAAAVGIYVRAGAIILGHWHGAQMVGLFSVATIMVEATHALPIAIMASVTPILLIHRDNAEGQFLHHFSRWLRWLTWLGIAVCALLFLAAPPLMSLLFGARYDGSIAIFELLIWSALFVFISVVSEVWIVRHNLQRYQLPKTLLAAAASIVLNLSLTPSLGAKGTAIATLVAYSVSALWANALFRSTRPLFRLQLRAFLPFNPLSAQREKY